MLFRSFKSGDPLARRVILDAGNYLGTSIASLVGMLNIKKFVLTGDMTCFGDEWLDAVRKKVSQSALASLAQNTQIEIGKNDMDGCILGASALLLLNGYSMLFTQAAAEQPALEQIF